MNPSLFSVMLLLLLYALVVDGRGGKRGGEGAAGPGIGTAADVAVE